MVTVSALRRALSRLAAEEGMRAPLIGAPTSATIPKLGRTIETLPDPELRALAHIYAKEAGLDFSPPRRFAKIVPEEAREYASAYDLMEDTPTEALTAAAWRKMRDETLDQLDILSDAGYKFDFNPPGEDPYAASPRLALEDLRNNKHLWIFPTSEGYGTFNEAAEASPLLSPVRGRGHMFGGAPFVANDAFRVVHDALGHAPIGAGFRAGGEENAFRHHASLYSDLARPGLAAETRGQNSWVNFGPYAQENLGASGAATNYADQKAGIMPDFVYNRGLEDFASPISTAELRKRIGALIAILSASGPAGLIAADEFRRAMADQVREAA